MSDLRKILASNMKLYRKKQGLSQAKLAEMVDITDNYIAMIETGRRFPSLIMLERIAGALCIDSLELFSIKPIALTSQEMLKTKIMADIAQILTIRLNESE